MNAWEDAFNKERCARVFVAEGSWQVRSIMFQLESGG